eukprot:jgi/Mesen1/1521/ME001323S00374
MATAELTERVRNVNVSEEEPLPLHWAPAGLRENLDLLTDDELALALMLTSEGQEHLFLGWPAPGMEDDDKHRFFSQVGKLDEEYSGGLAAYIQNARQLLADSREGKNPFEGYTPSVPAGEKLMFGDVAFEEYEARGVREARSAAFVLVAGGLGERLGYSGIKLDPLLRATGHIDGDMNDASGFSPFPGNINQLVIKLGPYIDELARTNGAIVEFEMDVWLAYSPVKNNAADAAAKAGSPGHSFYATSGELQIYRANCLILRQVGVDVEGPVTTEFAGQQSEVWARVVWSPQWALTLADVRAKVSGQCKLSQASTLVLDGKGIAVHNLDLDGALVVKASEGAEVRLSNLGVHNKGWQLEPIDPTDSSIPEEIRIRGFRIVRHEQREIVISQSGEHVISS